MAAKLEAPASADGNGGGPGGGRGGAKAGPPKLAKAGNRVVAPTMLH